MSDLPKAYDHTLYEHTWYALWEKASLFKSNPTSKKTFSIVIPPPNVTGVLHMGHALVNSLQDILIRHQRMQGVDAVWVPGTDHAGIATQMVLENFLKKTEGISRKDLSREAFIQRGWQWTQEHEAKIFAQLKQLGCSCDWSRKRFTMDESCTRAVRRCFKLLFDANIIYKGSYLVNWDPVMQTALADDEVEHESKEGFLWYFKYPIKGSSQHITIATTRPETMLGDTALAIHPEDLKHRHLLHQTAIVPLIGREIPIIADHRIDPSFGSGVIKVTPAHDPTDYQIGLDHQLECINIFTPTAHINEVGVSFKGMSREEARQAVVAAMQAQGLLDKVEPHTHMVGVSYRSKAIIEPMLSKQWFVSMKPFMETLKQAPTLIEFLPPHILNSYHHWIDHLKDWCISRQLWWGHRIPVWYHTSGRMIVSEEDVPEQVQQDPTQWHQDEDVLDTWFSSALWPLSSFGWPDMDQEARFYPTSVLITGHDILFFWVARMIAMSSYLTGKVPFHKVFLHGLIFGKSYWSFDQEGRAIYITGEEKNRYDSGVALPKGVHSKWEKISKSKGNVIDPLEMIQRYGADAVRMALCSVANQGAQIDLDKRVFEEWKHFTNKMWNGARFVLMHVQDLTAQQLYQGLQHHVHHFEDQWILSLLQDTCFKVNQSLQACHFDVASRVAYDFFWNFFCAYYVEMVKPILHASTHPRRVEVQKILLHVLLHTLLLLSPMAPFITEELFQKIKAQFGTDLKLTDSDPITLHTYQALQASYCIVATYPQGSSSTDSIHEEFAQLERMVHTIRKIRSEKKIALDQRVELWVKSKEPLKHISLIETLAKATFHSATTLPTNYHSVAFVDTYELFIAQAPISLEKELQRLTHEYDTIKLQADKLHTLLQHEPFLQKAAATVIEQQQKNYTKLQAQLELLSQKIKELKTK